MATVDNKNMMDAIHKILEGPERIFIRQGCYDIEISLLKKIITVCKERHTS